MLNFRVYNPEDDILVREMLRPDYVEWALLQRTEPHELPPDDPSAPDHMGFISDFMDSRVLGWVQAGIWHQSTGMVGRISLYRGIDGVSAQIGYEVKPSMRRRGFATAGVNAVAAFATQEPSLERLDINISPSNTTSQKVARKTGFEVRKEEAGYFIFSRYV